MSASAFTVVVDAGHGGHDPGALGKYVREKDLTLEVSKRVGKMIKDSCPSVDVYLTRTTDVYLTLQERANFVNKHNADLFICIHANSADNKNIRGAETFTLGVDKMQSNLDVAKRENSVILLEDDYQTKYQGFDPNSTESYIMFEFMQDKHIEKSLQFASLVQEQFSDKLKRADRGVRQAGFWVLHKSACPSVLIEMGFISNLEEEKYLRSEQGKQEISTAIFDAFLNYKRQLDKKAQQVQLAAQNADTQTKAENNKQQTEPKQAEPKQAEPKQDKPKQAEPQIKTTEDQAPAVPVFRVQIFSVAAPLKPSDPTFKGLKNCKYTKDGKFLKYTYGEETDYQNIKLIRDQLKSKFKDCFIVAFLNGKQITVKEALEMNK